MSFSRKGNPDVFFKPACTGPTCKMGDHFKKQEELEQYLRKHPEIETKDIFASPNLIPQNEHEATVRKTATK